MSSRRDFDVDPEFGNIYKEAFGARRKLKIERLLEQDEEEKKRKEECPFVEVRPGYQKERSGEVLNFFNTSRDDPKALNEILRIINKRKVYEAAILLFLENHGVVAIRLIAKIFEDVNPGNIKYAITKLLESNIIFPLDGTDIHKAEIKKIIDAYRKHSKDENDNPRYKFFGQREKAKPLILVYERFLWDVVPTEKRTIMNDKTFVKLFTCMQKRR